MSSNVFMNNQLERIADYIDAGKAGATATATVNLDFSNVGDMTGATAGTAGTHGLVPAPAAGDQDKTLHGDGSWRVDSVDLPQVFGSGSGSIITLEDAADYAASDLVIDIDPVQSGSGDPAPDNIRPISGWTGANIVVSPTLNAQDGTTYSITFPSEAGTVYGGTLDVTNGTLTVDKAMVDLGTLNWIYIVGTARFTGSTLSPAGVAKTLNAACSQYKVSTNAYSDRDRTNAVLLLGSTGKTVLIRDFAYTDPTAFKTAMSGVQLVYELATPITYQLTPTEVQMLLGTNNIWADTGDILTLEYIKADYNDLMQAVLKMKMPDYSASEQDTGLKWIDGKSIYQKTINFTVSGGGYVNNPTGITGIDTLIKHEGIGRINDYVIEETAYNNQPSNAYSIAIIYFLQNGELLADYRATTESIGATFYITLWYTKI